MFFCLGVKTKYFKLCRPDGLRELFQPGPRIVKKKKKLKTICKL